MRCIIILLVTFFSIIPASAQTNDMDYGTNNFAQDCSTCAAYYHLAATCMANLKGEDDPYALWALQIVDQLNAASSELTSYDTAKARFLLAGKHIMETVEGSCGNISRVMLKYEDLCEEVVKNPEKRFDYWSLEQQKP